MPSGPIDDDIHRQIFVEIHFDNFENLQITQLIIHTITISCPIY